MLHTHKNTTTGKLYWHTTETLFLEIGMDTSFTSLAFPSLAPLATSSLIKSTWQFLHENNLDLKHDIVIPDQHLNDRILMAEFKNSNASLDELISLNRCRLFLRAFHLSDIVDGSGSYILDDAWLGRPNHNAHRIDTWPNQGPLTKNDWVLWQCMVKRCFLGRGMKLQSPLGPWLSLDHRWPWYYSTYDECLYQLKEQGWLRYPKIIQHSNRLLFHSQGAFVDTIPKL